MDSREEVEAANREALQAVVPSHALQCLVYLLGAQQSGFHFTRQRAQHLVHRYVREFYAQSAAYLIAVGVARYQPVAGLSDDAQPCAPQLPFGQGHALQHTDAPADVLGCSVQNLTAQPLLPQVGKNLHRSGQRIAGARGEQVERPSVLLQPGQQGLKDALRATRADVNQTQHRLSVIGIVGALHFILYAQRGEELAGAGSHGLFVVQLRSQCIDSDVHVGQRYE